MESSYTGNSSMSLLGGPYIVEVFSVKRDHEKITSLDLDPPFCLFCLDTCSFLIQFATYICHPCQKLIQRGSSGAHQSRLKKAYLSPRWCL